MSDTAGMTIEQFDANFGLESNGEPVDVHEDVAANLQELSDTADRIEEMHGAGDNVELAEKREERRAAKGEKEPSIDDLLADLPQNGEEPAAEDEELEGKGDETPDPATADAGGEGGGGEEIDAAKAQVMFDAFLEKFGDVVELPFTANGQSQRAKLKEIRETHAPGYMGQDKVHETFQEARRLNEEAQRIKQQGEQAIAALDTGRKALISYVTEDPEGLVEDFVLPRGGIQGAKALHTALEKVLTEYEDSPATFEIRRQNAGLADQVAELRDMLRSGVHRPASPEGEPGRSAAQPVDMPDDFGFVAGKGYPRGVHEIAATTALKAASKVAGVPFDDVVSTWVNEGRQRPVFDVLEALVETRKADAAKVAASQDPPVRPRADGGKGGPKRVRGNQGRGAMPTDAEMNKFFKSLV